MMRIQPRNMLSWDFQVFSDGEKVAEVDQAWFKEAATVDVEGRSCRFYRERLMSGDFVLEVDGAVLARARKPSVFRRRFHIAIGDRLFVLEPRSLLGRGYVIRDGEALVGAVQPEAWYTRRSTVRLPAEWPTALRVFVVWLVIIMWKRDAGAASSSG